MQSRVIEHWPNSKGIIIATGPSLSDEQLIWARRKQVEEGWKVYGINNVYQRYPWLDVFEACNIEWWDHYWPRDEALRQAKFDKWTWDKGVARRYGINYIEGRWHDSLSQDPTYIHYGHASGYQILGLAYLYGVREFFLLGYDMAYPPGQPRHYFGEYPKALYHNPRTGPKGEFTGLIRCFETIGEDELGAKFWNLCPTSALNHFEKATIEDFPYDP